jgi:hypothetical protein
LGGQRIKADRNKRRQTAGSSSTGSEPGGNASRKIDSGNEFKLNKMRNVFFHDPILRLSIIEEDFLQKL